jgi:cystathionine beta-lyase
MKDETRIITAGRDPENNHGIVNPPVYHASTVLFPTLEALRAAQGHDPREVVYGRNGTPTTFAIQDAFCALEGGDLAIACGSGKAAIVTAMMAFLEAGDHVLITDSSYQPTRTFALGLLAKYGVEATFYDPTIGAGITDLIRPNTKVVYTESPGSITFEVQDLPAIAKAAHDKGVMVINDNTWAGGYFFKPFEHGADVVLQAGTKYIVGHSDAMLGLVAAREPYCERLWKTFTALGNCLGPDDAYLGQRGIRTLAVRLDRHYANGMALAQWLETRPEVKRVLHPGLLSHPGHDLWKRDFTGASGLFGVLLHPISETQLAAMLDDLELFGMGWSWGGYESLLVPVNPAEVRMAVSWQEDGQLLRIHAGLEHADDLIAELDAALGRLNAAV